jgi:hypothetical protein
MSIPQDVNTTASCGMSKPFAFDRRPLGKVARVGVLGIWLIGESVQRTVRTIFNIGNIQVHCTRLSNVTHRSVSIF